MPGDCDLMALHVAALFTHDSAGRMLRVNEPNGARAPRFFLGRTTAGDILRFRDDVDDALAAALRDEASRISTSPLDPSPSARFEALLASSAPIEHVGSGPAYVFPDAIAGGDAAVPITRENADLLRAHLPQWLGDVGVSEPMFAVMEDGHAVAVCASVRTTPFAMEAGVETAPGFRGRGHAMRATAAWAQAVRAAGRIPMYSTSWENHASRAVARKLGLRLFGSDLHIT